MSSQRAIPVAGDLGEEGAGVILSLQEVWFEYAKRPFVFVRPGGNFGDYLIYRGAEKLAIEMELRFRTLNHEEFMGARLDPEEVLYFHGGGGFNSWWSGRPIRAFQRAARVHRGVIIVGPQTYQADQEFLRRIFNDTLQVARAQRVMLFARELVSFRVVSEALGDGVELGVNHDTALYLSRADVLQRPVEPRYRLEAIRTDKEAVPISGGDGQAVRLDPAAYCRDFAHWISVHARAKAIVTNRLHSAMAGTILEIPTTLLANNYHKNRAVWEFSLRDRGVQWADTLPQSQRWGLGARLLHRPEMTSWRYRLYRQRGI
ncbi:MAG: polysaccharide pyruvyl transferase family protein [Candidatus Omnitrophica bacterium]|nr:polysaccharide pyruvyl transferase family protein [Candidatus Omnitrophota bacterium]